jgi:membrane protease YdiL (CAAX protease family)
MSDQPPPGGPYPPPLPPHWGPPPYGGGPQYPPPYGAPPPSGYPAYPPYPVPDYPPPGYPPQRPPVQLPPLEFHQLYRAGRPGWWWAGLASPVALLAFFLVLPLFLLIPFLAGFLVTGASLGEGFEALTDLDDPTPLSLAFLNVVLAAAIPFTFVIVRVVHGLKPRWLTSVFPRMRWMFFLTCIGLAVLALIATVLVSVVLPAGADTGVTGELNEFTRTTRDFALVVLLLTPFQAAGEEYLFRGYLAQALGSLFPPTVNLRWVSRGVAVLVPAFLFALAHGIGQSVPVFFDRFAFGIVAGVLVILTGGLEAAIAMHVLNNFLAFGLALAFSDMGTALNPSGGSWWSIPVTLTQSLVYLGLALWMAKRMGLSRTADPGILAASRGRV